MIGDDHGFPDVGCYGNDRIGTPNLDRPASQGVRFDNAYATSPQCGPSRSAIVTGRSAPATGTSRLHAPLRAEYDSALHALKRAAYAAGRTRAPPQAS